MMGWFGKVVSHEKMAIFGIYMLDFQCVCCLWEKPMAPKTPKSPCQLSFKGIQGRTVTSSGYGKGVFCPQAHPCLRSLNQSTGKPNLRRTLLKDAATATSGGERDVSFRNTRGETLVSSPRPSRKVGGKRYPRVTSDLVATQRGDVYDTSFFYVESCVVKHCRNKLKMP